MLFGFADDNIIKHTDEGHAGYKTTRKSIGGFVFCHAGGAFSESSKLQSFVASSSVEAEYIAQARSVRETLWVRKLCFDFNIGVTTVDIRAENQGAISIVKDFNENKSTKHIGAAYHSKKYYVAEKYVSISYIPTDQIISDCMTKALSKVKFISNRKAMGLKY